MRLSLISMLVLATASTACRRNETCAPGLTPAASIPTKWDGSGIKVLTSNAGLAPGLEPPYADERAQLYAEMIGRERDSDLICIQEVWRDEDRDRVIRALNLLADHVFTANTVGEGERPGVDVCKPNLAFEKLSKCIRESCGGTQNEGLGACAKRECLLQLGIIFKFKAECGNCLAAMAGHTAEETLTRCAGPIGASRVYGGRNGVIMASSHPLINPEVINIDGSNANRRGLAAEIEVPGAGRIVVGCTHLSSTSDEVPPNQSAYDTWSDEQRAQAKTIGDRLFVRAAGRPILLLGDLNVGPKLSETIHGDNEAVFEGILALGFRSLDAEAKPPFCSMCQENILHRQISGSSTIIDHILLRQPPVGPQLVPIAAGQALTTPVQITLADGRVITTNVSDHFGVRAAFKVEVPATK